MKFAADVQTMSCNHMSFIPTDIGIGRRGAMAPTEFKSVFWPPHYFNNALVTELVS